jgi:hypothetical protein
LSPLAAAVDENCRVVAARFLGVGETGRMAPLAVSRIVLHQAKDTALEPSLSLIVPVHNAETTLRRSLARVLELLPELTPRFEVLLIDDGSTDGTAELAFELAREFPQVRAARHQRRRGAEGAAATGSAHCRGEVLLLQAEGAEPRAADLERLWKASQKQPTQPAAELQTPALGRTSLTPSPSFSRSDVASVRIVRSPIAEAAVPKLPRPANFVDHLRRLSLSR